MDKEKFNYLLKEELVPINFISNLNWIDKCWVTGFAGEMWRWDVEHSKFNFKTKRGTRITIQFKGVNISSKEDIKDYIEFEEDSGEYTWNIDKYLTKVFKKNVNF